MANERTFEVTTEAPGMRNAYNEPLNVRRTIKAHHMRVLGGGVEFRDNEERVSAYFPRVLSVVEVI